MCFGKEFHIFVMFLLVTVLQAQFFRSRLLATSLCKMVATTINLIAKIKLFYKRALHATFMGRRHHQKYKQYKQSSINRNGLNVLC